MNKESSPDGQPRRVRHYQTVAERAELLSDVNPLVARDVAERLRASQFPLFVAVMGEDEVLVLNRPPKPSDQPGQESYYF